MAEFMQFDWHTRSICPDYPITEQPIDPSTPTDRQTLLQALRNHIDDSLDSEIKNNIPQDDKTLLKFLYARKFNIVDTLLLMQNYYAYRRKNAPMFANFTCDAPDIKHALENGLPGVLPTKDRKGRCVIIVTATNWDTTYGLISVFRSILLSLEHLANDEHNQARGFVVIVDWTEFTFRQSTNLKPSLLKLMIEGLQDCFPARFMGVHFIGQPWYVDAAITLIKQFLNEKIRERIFVHGNNLSTLHDFVHKDILPAELGGEQPSYHPKWWLEKLQEG